MRARHGRWTSPYDALDAQARRAELNSIRIDVGGRRGFAAERIFHGKGYPFEFDAQEVGWRVGQALDGVALHDAGRDAVGA